MDSRERVFTTLHHEEADRIPIDFWISDAALGALMKKLGASSKDELLNAVDADFRYIDGPLYRGPVWETGRDGSQRDIWGVYRKKIVGRGGESLYEMVTREPLAIVQRPEDLDKYEDWPSADWFDFSTIKAQCESYRSRKRVVVFSGDRINRIAQLKPYMYLRGMENTYIDIVLNKELFSLITKRIRGFYREYLTRLLESADGKIDIVMTGDDFGSQKSLLCSRFAWKELLEPGFGEYISIIRQSGAFSMHHSCGNIREIIPDMIGCGLDILQSIQPEAYAGEVGELKRTFGNKLCFNGTVSIQKTLPFGTPDEIESEVVRRVKEFGPGGGFIIGTAHNIQPDVPTENILCLMDAYRKHLWYSKGLP